MSDKLPAGEDLVVERRTKKKTKKKKAPQKILVEEKKETPAPSSPAPSLLNSLLSGAEGGEEEEEEKVEEKAELQTKKEEKKEEKPSATLGLLLSSGMGLEGEEEEEEEDEQNQTEDENPIEEGDSLDEPEEEEVSSKPEDKPMDGSRRLSWKLSSTLKNVWGSTGAKLSNLIASGEAANESEIEKPQSEREMDLQSCNYVLRVGLLNASTSAYTAVQTNVNILMEGLTHHLAVLVKARSDASTTKESLASLSANLQELKEFNF